MDLLNVLKNAFSSKDERVFNDLIQTAVQEKKGIGSYWGIKASDFKTLDTLLGLSEKEKVDFILYALKSMYNFHKERSLYDNSSNAFNQSQVQEAFYLHLLKTKLTWDATDVVSIADAFFTYKKENREITYLPLGLFINQIEKNFKTDGLPEPVKTSLLRIKTALEKLPSPVSKDTSKLLEKVTTLLFEAEHGQDAVKPTLFLGEDQFASYANKTLDELRSEEKPHWYKLVALSQKASGSKPSARYLDQSKELYKTLGVDKFKKLLGDWFDFLIHMKEIEQHHFYTSGNGHVHNYSSYDFLAAPNIDAIKGFVWMCTHFHDTRTLQLLASLAERSFKKIPGRGPAAASIGNACLYTLFKSKGLEGIGHLSRLKLRIKQSSTQSLIDKYLEETAKQQGVTVSEIEDLAVDDFELMDDKREFEIEGYTFRIEIKGVNDVSLTCFKPDGNTQKSIPAIVKDKASEKIKKIKELVKKIEVATGAQRDRIDRMLRSERTMTWEYFTKHYFTHGLLSFLTKGIIWQFTVGGELHTVLYHHGAWTTSDGHMVTPDDETKVSLWHPVTSSVKNIKEWRDFLLEKQLRQPIKQAFREVYILTDAEINTRTYSNRMAAHVIKQHQFNSLAKTRGWKYSLLGAYDDGRDDAIATLSLPEYGLRAEYWVNEVNADGAYNETGIWNYVATDQVRFVNPETNEPVDLVQVPRIPFSEIMRDVDLFVGVASVGNDPNWRDNGGVPAYRTYWESYSFGDLSEIAKNRRETLERLVPRLKIAPVASIQDKFLVVKGKLRTYKIHIGSTNILMEPNDQYLCIVPDRSQVKTENVFLPFEGDAGLSVVLSKAMLLADDDKIKDPTITSQINRK